MFELIVTSVRCEQQIYLHPQTTSLMLCVKRSFPAFEMFINKVPLGNLRCINIVLHNDLWAVEEAQKHQESNTKAQYDGTWMHQSDIEVSLSINLFQNFFKTKFEGHKSCV